MEGKLQGMRGLDPDVGIKGVKIADVQALVRGRFYYREAEVIVTAELVWLEGGEVRKTKLVIPARLIGAKIWPDAEPKQQVALTSVIAPQEAVASRVNVADVEKRFAKVPHDFDIVLAIPEGKRDFVEGETISYRVTPTTGCHMAILCHQVDGLNRRAVSQCIPACYMGGGGHWCGYSRYRQGPVPVQDPTALWSRCRASDRLYQGQRLAPDAHTIHRRDRQGHGRSWHRAWHRGGRPEQLTAGNRWDGW